MLAISRPSIKQADIDAVGSVLLTGNLVQGVQVGKFESVLAQYLGARHVIAVSSGTAALHLALMVAGIGAGDAVLVPNFTFVASANVVALVGARPVFFDVDPGSYCVSSNLLEDAITAWRGPERLAAVMPVLEFGHPAALSDIEVVAAKHNLRVIVDAACALGTVDNGARVGCTQELVCYSFHPRKTLTTGEGGAVATSSDQLAERLRRLRNHGIVAYGGERVCVEPGFNYRMTDFAAALGTSQFECFPAALLARRDLAAAYNNLLANIPGVALPDLIEGHSWQSYMVLLDPRVDRSAVVERMRACGIETGPGAQSLVDQLAFRHHYAPSMIGWHSRRLGSSGLVLPLCETYSLADITFVAESLRRSIAHDEVWRS